MAVIITKNFADEWVNYRESTANGSWSTELNKYRLQLRTNDFFGGKGDESIDPEMAEWVTLRGEPQVDLRIRWRVKNHDPPILQQGFGVWCRLPDPPFTPNNDVSERGNFYILRWRGTSLETGAGILPSLWDPSDTHDMGGRPELEKWYWLRFRVFDEDGVSYLQGKAWADGEEEPTSWLVENNLSTTSNEYVAPGGRFAVSNQGGGGTSKDLNLVYEVNYASAGLVGVSDDELRVRSNVSATTGSLLEATDAPALEQGIRESFYENVELAGGDFHPFPEALAPEAVRTLYYPFPKASQERLSEYAGGTTLGRMADAYPDPIRARAVDLVGTDTMTAQELLDALFERWASEFPWFTFQPVPDLRYRVEGDDYTGDRGVLTVEAVLYPQDEDEGRRLSMRQILDEILSIFPGTGITQDSAGSLVLRPTYGPDAPSSPSVTMTNEDAFSVSTGDRPDPRRVYNRARVTSRGYEFQEDQAIITPSFLAITDVDDTALRDTVSGREYLPGLAATIPYEKLVDTSQGIDVTYVAEIYSMNSDGESLFLEGSETDTITLAPGSTERIITVTGAVGEPFGATIRSEWGIKRRSDGINVRLIAGTGQASTAFGQWWVGHILKVDATGDAYVQRNESITGEFGYDTNADEIINSDGENVLANSQERYGEREISISTDAFALTPTQAQEIAQGLVLHHITPRVVRTVEQSWWRAFPVLPDHIGKIVRLPSGADALVEERTYTDDYTSPLAPLLASTFRATLTEPVALDPTETNPDDFDDTNLLAFDSGDWLRFDSGTLVEQT